MNNRRHKKLNKFVKLFFDFYAINELYLRCGGFREVGYIKYDVFVPERIFEKIKYSYEEIVETIFQHTVECLSRTTRGELIHNFYSRVLFQGDYMTPKLLLKKEGYNMKIFYGDGIIQNANKAYHLFTEYSWEEPYGGKAWANGAEALMDLKNIETTSDKVYWVDRVMDLYHNTGHILNKTEFSCLENDVYANDPDEDEISFLDFRAECKTIFDFIDYCSDYVRKLIIPRKRLLI